MIKGKHIARFFQALVSAGGEMPRTTLSRKVLGGNWTAKQVDELLQVPLLAGLITESKERVRGNGRKALRYVLTPLGFTHAKVWQLPVKADRIAPEEVQRQFRMLVQDGNSWAVAIDKDARAWRAWQVEQRRIRAEKAEAEKEKEKQEAARQPKPPRHRSEKDLAARKRFIDGKRLERMPVPIPPTRVITASPVAPVSEWNGVASPPSRGGFARPTSPPVTPRSPQSSSYDDQPVYLDGATAALIRKISAAGYQHCLRADGKVRYKNSEWLTPQEWRKRMGPGIID